ncbi:C40 family peptidase [Alteribacillus sp. JSM 102045]|uniref:C40 family peptidase n=1 Tax=Alteribacillus sp. JSM 102045 TaxID=1562101 RepID=UPI0035C25253
MYQGAEYLFGADSSSTEFFDCSSFTQRVYGEIGITLPRTSRSQFHTGTKIEREELETGDLVFFDTNEDEVINHVAIFINENTLLHATRSKGVDYTGFTEYWKKYYTLAVRVIE